MFICYKTSVLKVPKYLVTGFCKVLYQLFIKINFFVNIFLTQSLSSFHKIVVLVPNRLQHMKSKSMRQLHALPQNSEVIDMWKIMHHLTSRCLVVCNDYPFRTPWFSFFLQWVVQTIMKLKLKQASKEF